MTSTTKATACLSALPVARRSRTKRSMSDMAMKTEAYRSMCPMSYTAMPAWLCARLRMAHSDTHQPTSKSAGDAMPRRSVAHAGSRGGRQRMSGDGVEAAASTTRPRTAGARAEPAGTRGGGSAREPRACILDAAPARPPRTAARPALPTPVPLLTSQQPRKCVKDWMIKREMITRRTPPFPGSRGYADGMLDRMG